MTHPWEFGWEALVAIGTLSLAVFTGYLGWKTRTLAKSTADEVAAQARPLLVPGRLGPQYLAGAEGPLYVDTEKQWLVITIRNDGAGPAFFVRAELDPGGDAPEHWDAGSIGPAAEAALIFPHATSVAHQQLLLDYQDLAGRQFSSAIVLERFSDYEDRAKKIYRLYNVRAFRNKHLTNQQEALPFANLRELPRSSS
jgi:hypothetical protein